MDFEKFKHPESVLRPAPFWAINDAITPEETGRQMAEMIEAGLSGGFFHSRPGLITDYLGEEWFAAMRAALDVAKEKDGYVWLYDEDLWPSGNAGGQVAGIKDGYRAAALQAEFVPVGQKPMPGGEDKPIAAYLLIGRRGAQVEKVERIGLEEARNRTYDERTIFRRHYTDKIPWWGGESYSNLLEPEVTREFIHLTHEIYKRNLGEDFGGRIPGIFTDEPNIHRPSNALPWWDGFPDAYSGWHGRDFWMDLPYIYLDGPESRKIRLLVHRTLLRQFCEAYAEPLFKWCEANNLKHTGHFLREDSLEGQIACNGGGVMALYRYQHVPGIDHLCRQVDGMLLTCKQVSSAARQLGRSRVLTELFGVSRHTNTFEDFKWLGDYNLVLGANFFCPHLTWYSARGRRKRDYPPNWNYQQTYWKDLRPLNDYFTRLAAVLTSGNGKPDVLILHPIESATAAHRFGFQQPVATGTDASPMSAVPADLPGEDLGEVRYLDKMLRRTLDATLNAGYDADLGDEGYIEEIGSIEGDLFRIGEMSYPVVLVPPSTTWRPRTLDLLESFVGSGGKLIILGPVPAELDCEDAADRWRELATSPNVQTVPCGTRQIQEALDKVAPVAYHLRGPDGLPAPKLYVHRRVDGDQEIFFIANSNRDRAHDYVLTIYGKPEFPMVALNPLDGTRTKLSTKQVGKDIRYSFSLPPAGSLLIVAGQGAGEKAVPAGDRIDLRHCDVVPLADIWRFARSEENILVMDRISVSVDNGETWWDEDLEFRIRRKLADYFGTGDALKWQPWVAIRKGVFDGKGGEIILRYKFRSAVGQPKSAHLVIEDIDKGYVMVNGKNVNVSSLAWHFDRGFGKVDITDLVEKGTNTVDFKVKYDFLTEVETAYIVGNFGVRLANPYEGEIIEEPSSLRNGSWLEQGYPFYSGAMTYMSTFDVPDDGNRTFLRLVRPSGILYKVRVNGQDAGNILWRPFELELTRCLRPGKNRIEVDVVSSRQNTLGPLHEIEGDDRQWCGPEAFEDDDILRPEFSLFDYGLLGGVEIIRG